MFVVQGVNRKKFESPVEICALRVAAGAFVRESRFIFVVSLHNSVFTRKNNIAQNNDMLTYLIDKIIIPEYLLQVLFFHVKKV